MRNIFVVLLLCLSVVCCVFASGSPYVVFPLDSTGLQLSDEQSAAAKVDADKLIAQVETQMRKDPVWRYGDAVKTIRGEWAVPVTASAWTLFQEYPISMLAESDFPVSTPTEILK